MMILMMRTLAERVGPSGIEAVSFHPGLVRTSFGSDSTVMKALLALSMGAYGISAEAGAVPLVQLASVPDIAAPNGTYFDQLTPDGRTTAQAADRQLGRDLWAAMEARGRARRIRPGLTAARRDAGWLARPPASVRTRPSS
ncbi:hypothetical protein [Clavibacter tessellarius]|uniref:hypothetical protein n=1 Tax=Clavibacter tessellarius TaxID=31965 RepID=UPI003250814A